MLHAGLDLSRNRLDVCLLSDEGEIVEEFKAPSDLDGLIGLVRRVDRRREPVRAVVESMTGARFVHDTLERLGWDVDALALFGLMLGTLQLARALTDRDLSDQLLARGVETALKVLDDRA